ncbi:hypothetical protein MNB_SV-5-1601 [hydrothermal vent metagenome]|uniref:Uncharacterized protein n=1 Tax=hydrothermal vent metagenome TaxID=652676 RepID=A0A1W1EEB2_9ZZZZ
MTSFFVCFFFMQSFLSTSSTSPIISGLNNSSFPKDEVTPRLSFIVMILLITIISISFIVFNSSRKLAICVVISSALIIKKSIPSSCALLRSSFSTGANTTLIPNEFKIWVKIATSFSLFLSMSAFLWSKILFNSSFLLLLSIS